MASASSSGYGGQVDANAEIAKALRKDDYETEGSDSGSDGKRTNDPNLSENGDSDTDEDDAEEGVKAEVSQDDFNVEDFATFLKDKTEEELVVLLTTNEQRMKKLMSEFVTEKKKRKLMKKVLKKLTATRDAEKKKEEKKLKHEAKKAEKMEPKTLTIVPVAFENKAPFTIDIALSETIAELRRLIAFNLKVKKPTQLVLSHGTLDLSRSRASLSTSGITDGMSINVQVQGRGGDMAL